MIQLSDKVGQLLFFDQRRPGQIFFLFAQGQLGFFLPFRLLGDRLLNTTGQLFLFRQRAGRCRTHLNQRVFHLWIIRRTSFCGSSAFSSRELMLAFTMSAKREKIPIISILIVLVSGIHLWLS